MCENLIYVKSSRPANKSAPELSQLVIAGGVLQVKHIHGDPTIGYGVGAIHGRKVIIITRIAPIVRAPVAVIVVPIVRIIYDARIIIINPAYGNTDIRRTGMADPCKPAAF